MIQKIKQLTLLFAIVTSICSTTSCALRGAYEPITLSMDVPDGTVEFKAGWRAGCRSALSAAKAYAAAGVYNADHGTGVYQQHPDFYAGWSSAWFTCVIHASTFSNFNSMKFGPLQ